MNCDVNKLLEFYIGTPIVPRDGQVKRAVMELSSSSGACPSFNRMSGITEWANCVFLFVNVGGSDYENLLYFSRDSAPRVEDLVADDSGAACAVMTWFAQPRQDSNTPVLLRLQRSDTDSVVVFFRVVGVSEYIFGGRLQYVLFSLLYCMTCPVSHPLLPRFLPSGTSRMMIWHARCSFGSGCWTGTRCSGRRAGQGLATPAACVRRLDCQYKK